MIEEFFELLLRSHRAADQPIFVGEIILNLTSEFWAGDLGWRVGEAAKKLASDGANLQELIEWKTGHNERHRVLLQDMFDRHIQEKSKPKCTWP